MPSSLPIPPTTGIQFAPRWARLLAAILLQGISCLAGSPRVVINEIFYHAPGDTPKLQWIELLNTDETAVDLSDWSFSKGFSHVFPKGSILPSGGFLVLVRDPATFQEHYPGIAMAGGFTGQIKRKGERIELQDASGEIVDSVRFDNREEWPRSPDGFGSSLERICPTESGDRPENWESSAPGPNPGQPAGTPGRTNSVWSRLLPPVFTQIAAFPSEISAGQPIRSEVEIQDPIGGLTAWVHFESLRADGNRQAGKLPLQAGTDRLWKAELPGMPAQTLLRIWYTAQNGSNAERRWPSIHEPRPTLSLFIANPSPAPDTTQVQVFAPSLTTPLPQDITDTADSEKGSRVPASFIVRNPGSSEYRVFDHVMISGHHGGHRIHFHRDRPFKNYTSVYLSPKRSIQQTIAESLALTLYRRAGIPACESEFVQASINTGDSTWKLLEEHPNKAYLRRIGFDDSGFLLRVLPQDELLEGQGESRSRPDPSILKQVVSEITAATNAAVQWGIIRRKFDVDEVITYFAVNTILSHAEGFAGQHVIYRGPGEKGRFRLLPWDQSNLLGFFKGVPPDKAFHRMPVTVGAEGDRPPGWGNTTPPNPFQTGTNLVEAPWWRPGGIFSRPLLANPHFQRAYHARLRDLLEGVFTEDQLTRWLYGIRESFAKAISHDNTRLLELDKAVANLTRGAVDRRRYLWELGEIRNAPAYDRTQLHAQ